MTTMGVKFDLSHSHFCLIPSARFWILPGGSKISDWLFKIVFLCSILYTDRFKENYKFSATFQIYPALESQKMNCHTWMYFPHILNSVFDPFAGENNFARLYPWSVQLWNGCRKILHCYLVIAWKISFFIDLTVSEKGLFNLRNMRF